MTGTHDGNVVARLIRMGVLVAKHRAREESHTIVVRQRGKAWHKTIWGAVFFSGLSVAPEKDWKRRE